MLPSSTGYSTLTPSHNISFEATDDNISDVEDIKNCHHANRLLFDFLFLSTSGTAASFVLQFKPERGDHAYGKASWDGMGKKYRNPTHHR